MTAPASPHDEDALGKAFDARLARRLFTYVRPYGRIVLAAVVVLMVEGALQLAPPLLTRRVIDVAIPAGDAALVRTTALLLVLALVTQIAAAYAETLLTGILGQRIMHDLRRQLFAHLQRLPVPFFDRNPVGRLVTRVTSDVESLNELFTSGVVAGLGDLFTLLAITVLMVVVDWRMALAAYLVVLSARMHWRAADLARVLGAVAVVAGAVHAGVAAAAAALHGVALPLVALMAEVAAGAVALAMALSVAARLIAPTAAGELARRHVPGAQRWMALVGATAR